MSYSNFNLLPLALGTLIPPTTFQYRKCNGRTTTEFGQVISSYTEWKDAYGIVQPAGEANKHDQGIDFTQKTVRIWIFGVKLTATRRQHTTDQILYEGTLYNVIQVTDWDAYDNYCECVCQSVENDEEES